MKYFIDFEATQFSGEIISVGCVDENGREFYSLVKPANPGEMTEFIVNLTGIRPEALAGAPTADRVFADFLAWLRQDGTVEFYCYGDSDAYFLKRTLSHVRSFQAQLGISVIHTALVDYSAVIKRLFALKHSIALKKAAAYYRGEKVEQNHNSLADALLLKEVYEKSQTEPPPEISPFPEYQKGADLPKIQKRVIAEAGGVHMDFSSFGKAADWVMSEYMNMGDTVTDKTKSKVCSRIINAAEKEKRYCGYNWTITGVARNGDKHHE